MIIVFRDDGKFADGAAGPTGAFFFRPFRDKSRYGPIPLNNNKFFAGF